jgi:hypothetical protein
VDCSCEYGNEPSDSIIKERTFLDNLTDYHLLKKSSTPWGHSANNELHLGYQWNKYTKPIKSAKAVALLICIRDVPASDFGQDIAILMIFVIFLSPVR